MTHTELLKDYIKGEKENIRCLKLDKVAHKGKPFGAVIDQDIKDTQRRIDMLNEIIKVLPKL